MARWITIPVYRIHSPVMGLVELAAKHSCYVAGGYARWACSPREDTPPPGDIDIICTSSEKLNLFKQGLLRSMWEELDGTRSVTLRDSNLSFKVQLLKGFYGKDLGSCLDQFDLSVCRVALLSPRDGFADHRFIGDEQAGRLTVCSIEDATTARSVVRILRYVKKGYDISTSEIETVLEAIKNGGNTKVVQNEAIHKQPTISYADLDS